MNFLRLRRLAAVLLLIAAFPASAGWLDFMFPQPAMSLSASSVAFGDRTVNTTGPVRTLTVSNTGKAALKIRSVSLGGGQPGDFSAAGCVTTLPPGDSCTVQLQFRPTATGTRSTTLTLTSNAPDRTVGLSGNGVPPPPPPQPVMSLSASSVAFGDQTVNTTSAARTLTVSNTGKAPLTIQRVSLGGGQPGDFSDAGCVTTLQPGSSCAVQLQFRPTVTGTRSTTLTLTSNVPARSVGLSGKGVAPQAAMSLSASSVAFGDRTVNTTGPARTLTISNTGKAPLTIQSISLGGGQPGDFSAAGCITTLQPGTSCTAQLQFRPSATGTRSTTLTLTSNVPARTVGLGGNGVPPPDTSVNGGFQAVSGQIVDAAKNTIQIRGLNMYGFNADILIPQYLWQMSWKAQIQQVKDLGFNTIRVPFVPATLYAAKPGYFDPNLNPELVGKTPLQILDLWLAELDRQGLYFVLDFHSVSNQRQNNTWYTNDTSITWNGQPYSEDDWVRDLVFVAKRYAGRPHFLGVDLYNEPTGEVRWGSGAGGYTPAADWKRAVEKAGSAILAANPNLLIFVEGISANWDGVEDNNVPINWGENLRPQSYLPLNLPNAKLVFTPHSYGPDVYVKSTFSDPSFPANLAKDWEALFGQFYPQHPIVMGEFGGRYGNGTAGMKDKQWQDAFVSYLISKNIRGGFYWCYTPNSGDTGGILDDNLQVREDKMALLRRLWGN